jgi:hypothetical protein
VRSRKDIEDLKALWLDDPWFDLEDELGFEAYRDELREWRLRFEDAFDEYERLELEARARHNGRTVRTQQAIEEATITERRYTEAAKNKFADFFSSHTLRRSNSRALVEGLIDDLLFAAEARMRLEGLRNTRSD